jgi:GIY-YIG catalytic domain
MMLRDRLLARLAETRSPDYPRLAAEVLGVRNVPPELARRLVQQALVIEDRENAWRSAGERICRDAPALPGVYTLVDESGRPLYVGKAVNLRRRLRAHFAQRRWRALKPGMARAAGAEWVTVGSELEALLREAALIDELAPPQNVQVAEPDLGTRAVPASLVRDVVVIVPSIEDDSVELVAAAADGGWMMQRTRRSGADLLVHTTRLWRFFNSVLRTRRSDSPALAPIVFSWLAGRGAGATRLDPHDVRTAAELRARLAALVADEQLFVERLDPR